MSNRWIYLNGILVDEKEAAVSVLDRGLLYGDGAFETMRSYNGRIFAFERHFRRLQSTLAALRFAIPETERELEDAAHDLIRKNGESDAVVRITATRGAIGEGPSGLPESAAPTRIIHGRTLRPPVWEEGVDVILAETIAAGFSTLAGMKTLNYLDKLFAKQEAIEKGAFEALLLNAEGQIVEGASSNVFAVFGDEVRTPPIHSGALPGITRAICLEILEKENYEVCEAYIHRKDLRNADEVFITNSVMEIAPVIRIEDVRVGGGKPGPVCRMLREKYRKLAAQAFF